MSIPGKAEHENDFLRVKNPIVFFGFVDRLKSSLSNKSSHDTSSYFNSLFFYIKIFILKVG